MLPHVDGLIVVQVARVEPFGHQTSSSRAAFKRSRYPLHDGVVRGPNVPLVSHRRSFLFFLFLLSPPRIQRQPLQFFFLSCLALVLFITIFLFRISYKITNIFQFIPFYFLTFQIWSPFFYYYFIILRSYKITFFLFHPLLFLIFQIWSSVFYCYFLFGIIFLQFYPLWIIFFLIKFDLHSFYYYYFSLTSFLNEYFFSRFHP